MIRKNIATTEADAPDEVNEVDADDTGSVEDQAANAEGQDTDATQQPKSRRRLLRWIPRTRPRFRLVPALLVFLTIAAAALSAFIYFSQYRPDQQTDSAAARAATDAATAGSIAVLSYSPDTLDKDFANAESHLTGDFLTYYTQFTQQIVTPAAKQKGVKTTASVVRSAVSDLQPNKAVVLAYINQTTTSADRPDPAMSSSSVLITLLKSNNHWLISQFDPI
jgi:Mce-associated membrane protein